MLGELPQPEACLVGEPTLHASGRRPQGQGRIPLHHHRSRGPFGLPGARRQRGDRRCRVDRARWRAGRGVRRRGRSPTASGRRTTRPASGGTRAARSSTSPPTTAPSSSSSAPCPARTPSGSSPPSGVRRPICVAGFPATAPEPASGSRRSSPTRRCRRRPTRRSPPCAASSPARPSPPRPRSAPMAAASRPAASRLWSAGPAISAWRISRTNGSPWRSWTHATGCCDSWCTGHSPERGGDAGGTGGAGGPAAEVRMVAAAHSHLRPEGVRRRHGCPLYRLDPGGRSGRSGPC